MQVRCPWCGDHRLRYVAGKDSFIPRAIETGRWAITCVACKKKFDVDIEKGEPIDDKRQSELNDGIKGKSSA